MQTEEHHWYNTRLNRDMTLKVYGHRGRPGIVKKLNILIIPVPLSFRDPIVELT